MNKPPVLKPNYYTFRVAYDKVLILPEKQALLVLDALKYVEIGKGTSYDNDLGIRPIEKADIEINLMSSDEYCRLKMEAVLTQDE